VDLALLDQYGLPVSLVVAFGWYIWKQNQWIQKELESDMETSFARLENIQIELINQQKRTQMELAEIKGYIAGIESILQRLTGNGLKK
jgi:hypothetical protein